MKKLKKSIIPAVHILVWLIFLSLPAVFNPRRHGLSVWNFVDDLLEPPRWTNALLLIIIFYSNYYIIIPRLYLRRKYALLAASLMSWFGIFLLLNYCLLPDDIRRNVNNIGFAALGNSFNLFMFIIVNSFSFALCLYEQWQSAKEGLLNAEISFLKAQINPHFLFNTLNSIYSLALTRSDKTPDAIVKLSGMMRYSVSEANENVVSLSKEMDYIANYIDLQRLRTTEKARINYTVSGAADDRRIIPFMLIPFVENAFKYGINPEEDSDINIDIDLTGTHLHMQVTNNKVFIRKDRDMGVSLGINNTRKRLRLLYPGKHILDITDNAAQFIVSLKIPFS